MFGRLLSEVEQIFFKYFFVRDFWGEWEEIVKNPKLPQFAKDNGIELPEKGAVTQTLRLEEEIICKLFLAAVNSFDRQKILEIASAVWFLKKVFKNGTLDDAGFRDRERAKLLLAKESLDRLGIKWKVRQVAEYLAGKKVESSADGFKSLREKCRAMNFPLDEKRKIRRK